MRHLVRGGLADSKPDGAGSTPAWRTIIMKPYNLGKKLSSGTTDCNGSSWKKDYHLHTKRGRKLENWWEEMINYISRRTEKQKLKRKINFED